MRRYTSNDPARQQCRPLRLINHGKRVLAPDRVLGVQWHPEDPDADPEQLATLMTAFTTAVASTAQTKQGQP